MFEAKYGVGRTTGSQTQTVYVERTIDQSSEMPNATQPEPVARRKVNVSPESWPIRHGMQKCADD
jgi:hypothetical protein